MQFFYTSVFIALSAIAPLSNPKSDLERQLDQQVTATKYCDALVTVGELYAATADDERRATLRAYDDVLRALAARIPECELADSLPKISERP